jgi:hypothetical protein
VKIEIFLEDSEVEALYLEADNTVPSLIGISSRVNLSFYDIKAAAIIARSKLSLQNYRIYQENMRAALGHQR